MPGLRCDVDGAQGFLYARQALDHVGHTPGPSFLLSYKVPGT